MKFKIFFQELNKGGFVVSVTQTLYDIPGRKDERHKHFPESVRLEVDLSEKNLSKKQFERLAFLAENRFNKETKVLILNVRDHHDAEHNEARSMEIFKELMLESLRAPLDDDED